MLIHILNTMMRQITSLSSSDIRYSAAIIEVRANGHQYLNIASYEQHHSGSGYKVIHTIMLCIHLGTINLGCLYHICSGTVLFMAFAFADLFVGKLFAAHEGFM